MLIYINNYITKSKHTKHLIKNLPGVQHYKQKSRIFGSQSRLSDSKPRNNAPHAFCGIETIELPLGSSLKKSFLNHAPLFRTNITEKRL